VTDEELEQAIHVSWIALTRALTRDERVQANKTLSMLVCKRSPERVAQMELDRGLR
jgi:hypothetical protein